MADYVPKFVAIAPTPNSKPMTLNCDCAVNEARYSYKSSPYSGAQAASIARRNARERNRVKQVNDGFNALRKRLPAAVVNALSGGARRGSGKKLSKVDTLRMVVEYIKHMETILDESDAALGIVTSKNNLNTEMAMDTTPKNKSNAEMGMDTTPYEIDEGIFGGRTSPYSESIPSPSDSDCSSGVSLSYSSNVYYKYSYQTNNSGMDHVNDTELFDVLSW